MFRYFLRNWGFSAALIAFFLIIIFGFVVSNFTRDPMEEVRDKWGNRLLLRPPSSEFLLGSDDWGRDVFTQLSHATKNSLYIGFVTGFIVIILGVSVGTLAAYKGGLIDDLLMLLTNIVIVFPVYPVLLILAATIETQQRSLELIAFILSVISWPWVARAIRSQVLSLKEREFVNLARVSGMNDIKIAVIEVLPNMLAYIGLLLAIVTGGAIIAEAGISMIGLGPDPNKYTTLGTILFWVITNESIRSAYYWLYFPPGIILTTFFVVLYVIHKNLDEIFNPRLKRR